MKDDAGRFLPPPRQRHLGERRRQAGGQDVEQGEFRAERAGVLLGDRQLRLALRRQVEWDEDPFDWHRAPW